MKIFTDNYLEETLFWFSEVDKPYDAVLKHTQFKLKNTIHSLGDVKDALKEALQDDEDESIVRVERNKRDGTFDVQFAKVWEARGCTTLLNENEKLFDSEITVELLSKS